MQSLENGPAPAIPLAGVVLKDVASVQDDPLQVSISEQGLVETDGEIILIVTKDDAFLISVARE